MWFWDVEEGENATSILATLAKQLVPEYVLQNIFWNRIKKIAH